jgi:GT2 family glycosyltransferase
MSLEPAPEATVVDPTRNRAALLRRCLDSLDRQTVAPAAYDVVVVVDGSTDGTAELLRSLRPRYRLTVVEQRRHGAGAARNARARRATGDVLIFLDDDEEASPGLVAAHLAAHRGAGSVVAIGPIERRVLPGADRFARALAGYSEHDNRERASRPSIYRDVYGGNFSLPREVFERIGGFAPSLARLEDMELGYRLQAAGYRFVFVPDAVVSELSTRTWRQLLAEEELYGRSDVELYPFGAYDHTVRELVAKSGFRAACAVGGGWNRPATDDFELRRIEVRGTDSLFRFAIALALGELPRRNTPRQAMKGPRR